MQRIVVFCSITPGTPFSTVVILRLSIEEIPRIASLCRDPHYCATYALAYHAKAPYSHGHMGLRVAHRSTRGLTDASWFGGSHHGRWRASRDFQRLPKRLSFSPSLTPFHRASIGIFSRN